MPLKPKYILTATVALIVGMSAATLSVAQQPKKTTAPAPATGPTISPLTGVAPLLPNLSGIVTDKLAAEQLGKALFWDIAAGSDGMACASCHYQAGADIRTKNQVNPGLLQAVPGPDPTFSNRKSVAAPTGPNAQLAAADFPLHALSNPADRQSTVTYDTNDVFSSAGTFSGSSVSSETISNALRSTGAVGRLLNTQANSKDCVTSYDPANNPFHTGNYMYRKVEPRQTPSTINAVYYFRNFWDGRANNVFNGVDPFGVRSNQASPKAGVIVNQDGTPVLQQVAIANASLASQAVGPLLSSFEMSCQGRTFADVARRLLPTRPLAGQTVHQEDSLFSKTANLISPGGSPGLNGIYLDLVKKAFDPKYWSNAGRWTILDDGSVAADPNGFTQAELNFAFFWGLAIHQYESLLISDQSPFDTNTMPLDAQAGMSVFTGKGKCVNCHGGPVFSNAAFTGNTVSPVLVQRMLMGDAQPALYDEGFYNVGVRPTVEDIGLGGTDPYGNPLSFSRQYVSKLQGQPTPDNFTVDPCKFEVPFSTKSCATTPTGTSAASQRVAVDGSFKTPTLRNVGLSPPYMHNGGLTTLEDVVAFYNRGGDRRLAGCGDTTLYGSNCSNLDPDITNLGLTATEQKNLVAFLKSLTDDRVACHGGPFDHPELPIPNGHPTATTTPNNPTRAADIVVKLPATGVRGLAAQSLPCFPNSGSLFGEMQTVFKTVAK